MPLSWFLRLHHFYSLLTAYFLYEEVMSVRLYALQKKVNSSLAMKNNGFFWNEALKLCQLKLKLCLTIYNLNILSLVMYLEVSQVNRMVPSFVNCATTWDWCAVHAAQRLLCPKLERNEFSKLDYKVLSFKKSWECFALTNCR